MFNPSELEGEVDHTFFDSEDDGDSGLSRDTGKKMESLPQRLQEKQMEKPKAGVSPGGDVTRKQVNNQNSKDEERNRAFRLPIVPAVSNKVIGHSSDSEEDSNLPPKRQNRTFMALLTDATEVRDKDVCVTDEESSSSSAKCLGSKLKKKQSPKKLMRNRPVQSSSPTSTESSEGVDSDSCSSSYSGRSSSHSPTIPKAKKLSSGGRKARLGSAGSRDFSKESESMTDVSPLSSPDISPEQSLNLDHREKEEDDDDRNLKDQQPREGESVPSSGLSEIHPDDASVQDIDEYSFTSESQLGGKLVFRSHGGKNRKNFSFRNDEVRRIDQENQRLLRALSRLSSGSRPNSAAGRRTPKTSCSPVIRPSSSALNRQREQKRIERENLALLKRLESAKPTQGMRRSEQLADYHRHVGYLEGTKIPSPRCSRQHSSRPEVAITPVPRSKHLSAARPAWC